MSVLLKQEIIVLLKQEVFVILKRKVIVLLKQEVSVILIQEVIVLLIQEVSVLLIQEVGVLFKTGENCVLIRRDIFEVYKLMPGIKYVLNDYGIPGFKNKEEISEQLL